MAKAVGEGLPKRRIEESAAYRQAKIDSKEEVSSPLTLSTIPPPSSTTPSYFYAILDQN